MQAELAEPRTIAELQERYRTARQNILAAGISRSRQLAISRAKAPTMGAVPSIMSKGWRFAAFVPARFAGVPDLTNCTGMPIMARVKEIIAEVARKHHVRVSDILGDHRSQYVIDARFEAIRLVESETKWSYPRIGKVFNRDHTSIMNAIRRKVRKPHVARA